MSAKVRTFLKFHKSAFSWVLALLGTAVIVGCGSSGDSAQTGVFTDSPVSGLTYQTPTFEGTTDADGTFHYKDGQTVTFSIGDLALGSATGAAALTPVDIVDGAAGVTDQRVTNLCVLLQTLDEDGDLNNGIQISPAAADIVSQAAAGIDFDQTPAAFAADSHVTTLLADLNAAGVFAENASGATRTLQGADTAQAHMDAFAGDRKVVRTEFGSVRGFAHDANTWTWLGIPYAKPPVGDLRWRAPQDPEPWSGVRDASAHCSECMQQDINATWHTVSSDMLGSEDCLYLDIYRPKTDQTGLPVYVFFHGGSNNFGSAALYDGSAFAARANAVMVVVQYRLNVLGWFTNAALRDGEDQADASGNYGALDQIKALQWVQDNIAAFGGDPDRVTIGGQSAGAHDTLNLIMSPLARGLFSQAVVESAAMDPNTLTGANGDGLSDKMIDQLLVMDGTAADTSAADTVRAGMSDDQIKTYLRSQTAADLIRACITASGGSMPFHPAFIDGYVMPADTPATPSSYWPDIIATGDYNHVPVLIGGTHDEWKPFMPLYGASLKPLALYYHLPGVPSSSYTWDNLYDVLNGDLALTDVLPLQDDRDFYIDVASLESRTWKATYVDAIAEAFKQEDASNPVYAYRFDWEGGGAPALDNFAFILGAGHSFELPFFYGGDTDSFGYSFIPANAAGRTDLQHAMMDYLAAFISTGNPNLSGSDLLDWQQWDNGTDSPKFIVFNADTDHKQLSMATQIDSASDLAAAETAAVNKYGSNGGELLFMQYQLFNLVPSD